MNPQPLTNAEREELRHAVLEILAERFPVALPVAGVRRWAAREVAFPFTDDDITAALEFWRNDGADPKATFDFDSAGSSRWWRITQAGLLHVERGR